jgi:hypothetical protein
LVGRSLGAEFEVEIADPDGKPVWQQAFSAGATGHRVPSNYGDVRLATMDLDGSPLRPWTMRMKILAPDPMFKTTQTQLKLYKRQYDPGMGGLMNYVMMIPAALFFLLALALSLPLARGGSRAPLILTAIGAVGFLWLLVRP